MNNYVCEKSHWDFLQPPLDWEKPQRRDLTDTLQRLAEPSKTQGGKWSVTYTVFLSWRKSLEENSLSTSRKARLGGG